MIRRLLSLLLIASPCWALEQTTVTQVTNLYPRQVGTYSAWALTGVSENYDAVNEYVADDATTYLEESTVSDKSSWFVDVFVPIGLVEIDSLRFTLRGLRSGGSGSTESFLVRTGGSDFTSDNATLTTSWADYNGHRVQNPATTADWTVAEVNASEFGVNHVNDIGGALGRVTQFIVSVYWVQAKQADTIDTQSELLDTYMASDAHTNKNFGSTTVIPVGRSISSWTGRGLYFLDTVFWTNWKDYYIDSARLDLTTETMFGGAHDIYAHTITWGGIAGTNNGTAQNGSSCWNYSRYHTEADAWREWDKDGADSCTDEGGRDRYCEAQDTVTVSVDETVYSIDVTEWLNVSAGFDWVRSYGYSGALNIGWNFATLPIILRLRQGSEALPDTQIQFYSMDHATSSARPKLRVYGTHR